MSNNIDVLMYAEDPGAANYLMHLPEYLAPDGLSHIFLTKNAATDYLTRYDKPHYPLQSNMSATEIIKQYTPKLLLIGTSEDINSEGLRLIKLAQQLSIPTIGVVDGAANVTERYKGTTDDPLAFAPDILFVIDDYTKSLYVELGFNAKQIFVTGHPHFEYVVNNVTSFSKEEAIQAYFPKVRKEQQVIVFLSELSTGLSPEQYQLTDQYTLFGRGDNQNRTNIIVEELLDAVSQLQPRPATILRLHPKNKLVEFDRYIEEFDGVSQSEPVEAIIAMADLVVGMTTSLLEEALLLHKAVLAILPRKVEQNWLPGLRSGLIPIVTERAHLQSMIEQLLQQKSPVSDKYKLDNKGVSPRIIELIKRFRNASNL